MIATCLLPFRVHMPCAPALGSANQQFRTGVCSGVAASAGVNTRHFHVVAMGTHGPCLLTYRGTSKLCHAIAVAMALFYHSHDTVLSCPRCHTAILDCPNHLSHHCPITLYCPSTLYCLILCTAPVTPTASYLPRTTQRAK